MTTLRDLTRITFGIPKPSILELENALIKAQSRLALTGFAVFVLVPGWWKFPWLVLAVWDGADWWRLSRRRNAWHGNSRVTE